MSSTGIGSMPNSSMSARWKLSGRSVIHLPPVTLISPPLRIDSIPSVTTIAGIRR